jgi:hypothetical protein
VPGDGYRVGPEAGFVTVIGADLLENLPPTLYLLQLVGTAVVEHAGVIREGPATELGTPRRH